MKKNLFKIVLFSAVTAVTLGSCSDDDKNDSVTNPPVAESTRWVSLTGSFPDAEGTAGNGGTRAYAITLENAANPNYEVDLFKMDGGKYTVGFALKSSRTARVQASEDGKFLYNIQYTGTEGGVFNKYKVSGEGKYEEDGFELNTATILGTSPRWVKAAEGIGVGVFANAVASYEGTAPNFVYKNRDSEIKIATIDLNNTAITNTVAFNFPWTDEERAAGYSVGRVDVPVLNATKDRLFIGCNVSKVDPSKTPTINADTGIPSWPNDAAKIDGTKTLVVDFPSLRNPRVITSTLTKTNNHGYRTMTQYVGTDGNIYQATATSGPDIIRISKTNNSYDPNYHFNLNTALNVTGASIKAWRYIKDGVGVVLYTITGTNGGYVALINLNDKTAEKLTTDVETDAALSTTLGQFQNIGIVGDNVYLPLTPQSKDGNIYIVNWKTKAIKKGAKLKGASGSFYLGAY